MKTSMRMIVRVWLPLVTLLGVIKLSSLATGITLRQLMLDPTESMRVPFYIGIVSNIGVLLWAAAAAICLFTALALESRIGRDWRDMLLVSGGLTLLLLLDDLLRLHDEIFPVYLGIKGDYVGMVYAALFVLYFLRFRKFIGQRDFTLLALALGFFAVSVAIDIAPPVLKEQFLTADILLMEDGAKLLGIATWLGYFVQLSGSVVRQPVAVPAEVSFPSFTPDAVESGA